MRLCSYAQDALKIFPFPALPTVLRHLVYGAMQHAGALVAYLSWPSH
jgi:hypothetical protein